MKSYLHVLVAIIFGIFFIYAIFTSPSPDTIAGLWYGIIWSIIVIPFTGWMALNIEKVNESNARRFEKWYEKTHFFVFKKQAETSKEPYMKPFGRSVAIVFVLIGTSFLIRDVPKLISLYTNKMENKNIEVITFLEREGSDLTQPHKIDFSLYFPSYKDASDAGVEIVKIYPKFTIKDPVLTEEGMEWLLQVEAEIIPELSTMNKIEDEFNQISMQFDGDYDGWGALLVK